MEFPNKDTILETTSESLNSINQPFHFNSQTPQLPASKNTHYYSTAPVMPVFAALRWFHYLNHHKLSFPPPLCHRHNFIFNLNAKI
jgi:hypothetical protein